MQFHVSLEKLDEFAGAFWSNALDNRVFAFHGEMGAGKTTMITALCKHKCVKDVMGSPTFSIINEYFFSENGHVRAIYHIDLYRLNSYDEVIKAGVEDCIYSNAICMVEWPEKAPELFKDDTVHVYIQIISESERKVDLMLPHMHNNSFK